MKNNETDAVLQRFYEMATGEIVTMPIGETSERFDMIEMLAVPGGWLFTRLSFSKATIALPGGKIQDPTQRMPEMVTTTFVPKEQQTFQLGSSAMSLINSYKPG